MCHATSDSVISKQAGPSLAVSSVGDVRRLMFVRVPCTFNRKRRVGSNPTLLSLADSSVRDVSLAI